MNARELKQQRAALLTEAKALVEKGENENRSLSADEVQRYDGLMAQINGMTQDIQRREQLEGFLSQIPVATQDHGRLDIGMSPRETRQYSLVRALRAAVQGDWRGAELEREASEAMAQRIGRTPNGFFVPTDVLRASAWDQRTLTTGSAVAGYLVPTDTMSYIELLRNQMMCAAAGATIMSGLVGNVSLPRQSGAATAYWVAEGNAPSASNQVIEQVSLTPKTVAGYTDITRKLLMQSSQDVEMFVRNDLGKVLGIAIDYAALHGDGSSNAPTGIASTSGIGSVVGGTNGLAPAWSHIVSLEKEVAVDNADIGKLAYMTNPKVRGKLRQTYKWQEVTLTSGSYAPVFGGGTVWGDGQFPLNGYPAYVTNQVRSNITKNTSNLSAIFFGNWADLIIGLWGTLDILVDPYSNSTSGTVRVVAMQDCDIAVRHPESFAAMLDAITV